MGRYKKTGRQLVKFTDLKIKPERIVLFWQKVQKSDGCWIFLCNAKSRYPYFCNGYNKQYLAHRLSYFLTHGTIPPDMVVDHICRNTYCVNPAHLEAVTIKENTNRGVVVLESNAAHAFCRSGHAISSENTKYVRGGTERICRLCEKNRWAVKYLKQKEAARLNGGVRFIIHKKSHCVNGHEYTPENTLMRISGRKCKICVKASELATRLRRLEKKTQESRLQ